MSAHILVLDDEKNYLLVLETILEEHSVDRKSVV